MLERGRYLIVAPDPCGDGYVATEVEPTVSEFAMVWIDPIYIMRILSSCFLTQHYRRFPLAKGATPEEAVTNWFQNRRE